MTIPQEITYWYRNPLKGYFSIENVFNGVASALEKEGQVAISKKYVPLTTGSLKALRFNRDYAKKNSGAINHITGDIYYVTPILKGKKILTIHDFVLFRRKVNPIKEQVYKYLWYTQPIKSADIITVISPQIKKELLQYFKVDERKVRVISNFYNPFFASLEKNSGISSHQVLFIGDTEHKNLPNAIKALTGLHAALHIVGKPMAKDIELLKESNIPYKVHTGITDEELGKLYQQCSVLLFPSLYEGFGLPIIEAQAMGLPVITSNIDPMKWVAGKGAVLVNPNSVEEMREAIMAVQSNEQLRATIVEEGFQNIHRFSVETVAQQYLNCYQELI